LPVTLVLLANGCASPPHEFESLAPFRTEALAVAAGQRLDVGSARLEGPREIEVMQHGTWRLIYTAGRAGVHPGGGVRVAFRHLHHWSVPQIADPTQAGWVTVRASSGAAVRVTGEFNGKTLDGAKATRFMGPYFPWQNVLDLQIGEPGLAPDDRLEITFGDTSGGGPGMRAQPFDECRFVFKVWAGPQEGGFYFPLATQPSVSVVAAQPSRLSVVMPSVAAVGEPVWCLVRAEDRYGNPATSFRGVVRLSADHADATLAASHRFTASDRGAFRFEGLRFATPGIVIVTAEEEEGDQSARGNPLRVHDTPPAQRIFWGDLHGHTLFSDGRGTVEAFYDFARRVAGLDFCAVTDHAFEVTESMWEHSKKVTNAANEDGEFVTLQAYEWSGVTSVGGDHNVFFLDPDPPILRSLSYYHYDNLQMVHEGDSGGVNHIEEVFRRLVPRLGDRDIFVIPHWGGRPANPAWHCEKLQRMVEVFSEHRRSHAWAERFLQKGHRLGTIASTDGHFGNPGHGYLKPTYDWDAQEIGMAAVAVHASAKTRGDIFRALYDRRVYATSGDRIILDVRVGGESMGGEITTSEAPVVEAEIIGTAPIRIVKIRKGTNTGHETVLVEEADIGEESADSPAAPTTCELRWTDPDFDPSVTAYYWVYVVQANGEEAISSPVWVN